MKEITNSAISLLKKLIRTESFSSNEEKTSLLIQNWFKQHNINFKTYKNNVYAYNMFFDENKPTILLNSHHDTVMPNSGYTNDPFEPGIEPLINIKFFSRSTFKTSNP